MNSNHALLIRMLLGRALDGILAKVQGMNDAQVKAAIESEEIKTSMLLDQMRALDPREVEENVIDGDMTGKTTEL